MISVIKGTVAGAVLAFALLAGGDASAAVLPKDANTTCPVMTEENVDPDLFVDYKGKRIFVCCMKCKKQFRQDPAKYLARMNNTDDSATVSTGTISPSPKR